MSATNGKLARQSPPEGRGELADGFKGLAEELNAIRFRGRWLASFLESDDEVGVHVDDGLAAIGGACDELFALALGVRIGRFGVALPGEGPPSPILDAIEGKELEEAQAQLELARFARDGAESQVESLRHDLVEEKRRAESLELELRETRGEVKAIRETMASMASEAGSLLARREKESAAIREPVVNGKHDGPIIDGDSRDEPADEGDPIEGGAVELPDLDAPGGPEWRPAAKEVEVEEWAGRYWDVSLWEGGKKTKWVARVEAHNYLAADEIAAKLLPEPPLNSKFVSVSAREEHDAIVDRLGGLTPWKGRNDKPVRACVLPARELAILLGREHPHDPVVGRDPVWMKGRGSDWRTTPAVALGSFGFPERLVTLLTEDCEVETAGEAWKLLESSWYDIEAGWEPSEVESLRLALVAIRAEAGDPVPAPAPTSGEASTSATLYDGFRVDGKARGPVARKWIGRVLAGDAIEAEEAFVSALGLPGLGNHYAIVPADEDRADVFTARAARLHPGIAVDVGGKPLRMILAERGPEADDLGVDLRPEMEGDDAPDPAGEPIVLVNPLDTDELLTLALHRRTGMSERWESMQRDGASDLEVKAAIGRSFDLGLRVEGKPAGKVVEDGGCCTLVGGPNPKFWAQKDKWEGRPTLESNVLVRRVRQLLAIPGEDGRPIEAKPSRRRKGVAS